MLKGYTRILSQQVKIVLALSLAITISFGLQAQNQLFKEDFENGLGSEWTVNNLFSIVNSESWNGNASGGSLSGSNTNSIDAVYQPTALQGGNKLDSVVFYWYEEQDNNGFRFQFIDNANDTILGVASDNPQWEISTDGTPETQGYQNCFEFNANQGFNTEYEDWTRVKITFDWQNGEYTYEYDDQDDGASSSGTRALAKSTNVAKIFIKPGYGQSCIGPADHVIFDDITGYGDFTKKPVARFSVPDTAYFGQDICIKSNSLRATGYEWFVDGTEESTADELDYSVGQSATTKTIKLVVSNKNGTDTLTKPLTVAPRQQPNADFLSDKNIVDVLDIVQFSDLTTGGPSSWQWTFPNARTGSFIFPSAGTGGSSGGITLTVQAHGDLNTSNSFTTEAYDVVDENGKTLKSGIGGNGPQCSSGFNNNTTINLSYSELKNYLKDGKFSLTLTAKPYNGDVDDICDQNDGFQNDNTALEGRFILSYPTGQGCLTVVSNTSSTKGCGSFNRSFANSDECGFTITETGLPQPSNQSVFNNDTAQNPSVQFVLPGSYDVCLEASNKKGSDKICKNDFIIVREDYKICREDRATGNYGLLLDQSGQGSDYQSNRNCSFTISPCAKNLRFNFETFDLASGDFLRVYDGTDTSGTPLWDTTKYGSQGLTGDLDGRALSKFRSSQTGQVHVVFTSDRSNQAEGFALGWITDSAAFQKPTAGFEMPDTVCPGDVFMVQDTSSGKNLNYTWNFNNDSTITGAGSAPYAFNQSGSKFVELIIDACGGGDTVSQNVFVRNVNTKPNGDFTVNSTTTIVGGILNFTANTKQCSNYFEWSFSEPVQFVQGTGPGSKNPKVRFLTEGPVDAKLRIGNEQDTIQVNKPDYINVKCIPEVRRTNSDVGISRVQLGNLDNQSPIGQSGYTDYFNMKSATAELEEEQIITISRNTSVNAQNVKLWIDLNGDSDFDESNELIASWDSSTATSFTDTFKFSNPKYLGERRMRIGVNIGDLANTPCGPNDVGEFEDYKLIITRDQTPPTFQLKGDDTLTLRACTPLSTLDTGAIAFDNLQGRLGPAKDSLSIDTTKAGLYSIKYFATDTSGNTGTRIQRIRVLPDTTKPTLTINGSDTALVSVFDTYSDPGIASSSDACSGIDTVTTMSSLNTNQIGDYNIVYRAKDEAGNVRMVTRLVQVVDTTRPSVILAGNNPARVALDGRYFDAGIATLSDNFYDSSQLQVMKMGNVNPNVQDTFTITYKVTDPSGNTSMVKREVIVEDRIAPTVTTDVLVGDTLQGDITLPVGNALNVEGRTRISDNAGSGQVTLSKEGNFFSITNAAGEATSLGTFNARYVYTDQGGNSTTINLDVTVVDNEKPEISLKPGKSINLPRFDSTRYGKAFDTGATATDNHKIAETRIDTTSNYFTRYATTDSFGFSTGIYEITYVAEDSAGNVARKNLLVNVQESITGVQDEGATNAFKVYPNPSDGNAVLEIRSGLDHQTAISLMNSKGQEVKAIEEGVQQAQDIALNLKDVSKGVYFLRLTNQERTVIRKVVLQ